MRVLVLFLLTFGSVSAWAGFYEIGASANYRYSGYDANNYVQSLSYTASVSYYFWEMCAVEVGYTTGYSKEVSGGNGSDPNNPKDTIEDNIALTSADLVLSFADRQDPIRPYVKLGGGYLIKDRYQRINQDNELLIAHQEGLVPSGGLGLAINITQAMSIKLGVDAWTSPPKQQPVIVDYAGRAGLSWMF
jgi:outer membrane protein W